ncbi:hypothetical protein [Candidatus Chlorohelix sp.]|uniref:COG1470 family protein n=1 Tax=Candidatus Chlorohelix sp. TaxID=3139201 RepID=UPI00306B161B
MLTTGIARLELKPQTTRMTVLAGANAEQIIKLSNQTGLIDDFDFSLVGLPTSWFSFSRETLKLLPNWEESITFKIEVSANVRPNLYSGKIVTTARSQPGIRTELLIEVDVLAPLKVDARLQPHRSKGFKANYTLLLRNRSMSPGKMSLQLTDSYQYCVARFSPPQIEVMPGTSQAIKVQVQLKPKTPRDEAQQPQQFEIMVEPNWTVAGAPVITEGITVEGEYIHQSRWSFITRHPLLSLFCFLFLLIAILWSFLILPAIQELFILNADRINLNDQPRSPLRIEQKSFSDRLQNDINPLAAFTRISVTFSEAEQKVKITLWGMGIVSADMTGKVEVDQKTGSLFFTADDKNQPDSFPWFLIPMDRKSTTNKVMNKINQKLKNWLINTQQRVSKVEIEGGTLYLTLRSCDSNDPACIK